MMDIKKNAVIISVRSVTFRAFSFQLCFRNHLIYMKVWVGTVGRYLWLQTDLEKHC